MAVAALTGLLFGQNWGAFATMCMHTLDTNQIYESQILAEWFVLIIYVHFRMRERYKDDGLQ